MKRKMTIEESDLREYVEHILALDGMEATEEIVFRAGARRGKIADLFIEVDCVKIPRPAICPLCQAPNDAPIGGYDFGEGVEENIEEADEEAGVAYVEPVPRPTLGNAIAHIKGSATPEDYYPIKEELPILVDEDIGESLVPPGPGEFPKDVSAPVKVQKTASEEKPKAKAPPKKTKQTKQPKQTKRVKQAPVKAKVRETPETTAAEEEEAGLSSIQSIKALSNQLIAERQRRSSGTSRLSLMQGESTRPPGKR